MAEPPDPSSAMEMHTLETADLINRTLSLVASARIYSVEDCKAAADYLRRNCTGDPNNDPEENATLSAIAALLDSQAN